MSYVIYEKESTYIVKKMIGGYRSEAIYKSPAACKAQITRLVNEGKYKEGQLDFEEYSVFLKTIEKKKKVKNMMTGKEVEIPVNTPAYLDPSRETYWSM